MNQVITVGADPELFVTRGGVPHSAYGLIPGTKKAPHKVKDGAVQIDGMALEYNVDPATTAEQFIHNHRSVMSQLRDMVPGDFAFNITPAVRFEKVHFDEQPIEAKELGCEPDYDAYNRRTNPRPNPNGDTLRTAAGHVHVGFTEGEDPLGRFHMDKCHQLAIQLDYYLGVPSLFLDNTKEAVERRALYGNAGAFRPKSYGMEYRTLSNFWLKSDELMRWVFESTVRAVEDLMAGKDMQRLSGGGSYYARNAILYNKPDYVTSHMTYFPKMREVWEERIQPFYKKLL